MDKLVKYLKENLHLSDDIIRVVVSNIKVKYVVPTYHYNDLLFTDLNVLEDSKDEEFNNVGEFNEIELSSLIYTIINNNAFDLIPKQGFFSHLKPNEEYWAVYKNTIPINISVHSIKERLSWDWHIYNYIVFINKVNNKTFSYWDEDKTKEDLFLFSTREEAVAFYKDKNNLN